MTSTDDAPPAAAAPAGDHRLAVLRSLTNLQTQIWTSQRLAPDAPLANMGTVHRIAGRLDPDRFVQAVDTVVRAADSLRGVRWSRSVKKSLLFRSAAEIADGLQELARSRYNAAAG